MTIMHCFNFLHILIFIHNQLFIFFKKNLMFEDFKIKNVKNY